MTTGRRRAAGVLTCAALAVSGCGVGLDVLPAPSVGGQTYRLTARFTDVENLTVGADVKLGGVVIGKVADITTHDYRAAVVMDVQRRFRLRTDTHLQIRSTTPLGDDYVAVTQGRARRTLAAGATVPLAQTATAPGIEDTFAAVSTLLNYGGLDKLHTIVDELRSALHGRTADARALIENLDTVVANLDRHRGDIDRALDGLDKLAGVLAGDTRTITSALDLFPDALRVLSDDTARLRTLVGKISTLGVTVKGLLDRGQSALLADLDNLQPTLAALRARDDELVPTLQALTTLGKSFERAAPGDYLNVYASISVLLNAPPARPQAGGYDHSDGRGALQDAQSLALLGVHP